MAKAKVVPSITSADKPVFFWEAEEFKSHEKKSDWYVYLILIAIVLIGVFIYLKLWLAGGVVVAAVLAIWSQSASRGLKRNYAIYQQGITINEKVYSFDQFKSFWAFPYQDRMIIRFEQVGRLSIPVEMPIEDENAEQVILFLAKHLPEQEERGEDIADKVNRWIKF